MGTPSLSVILCNYNHARFVGGALEAILAQSLRPKEVIVLDDGSTDDSVSVIEGFVRKDPIVRLIRNERNRGLNYSGNRAVAEATGDYYHWASSDDRVLPRYFEEGMRLASRYPKAGIVFGQVEFVDENWEPFKTFEWEGVNDYRFVSPVEYLRDYLDANNPGHCLSGSCLFRRECLIEVGGYRPELGSYSDMFAIRAIALKHGAVYMPVPCIRFRDTPTSLSVLTARSGRRVVDIMARFTWLMRSPQFRDRFPEGYVKRWETVQKKYFVNMSLSGYYEDCRSRRERRVGLMERSGLLGRLAGPPVNTLLRAWFRVGLEARRALLLRHRGDLSCYNDGLAPSIPMEQSLAR